MWQLNFMKLSDCTFLKRRFVRHPYREEWMAPLEEESVLDCVNWIHKGADPYTATLENVRAVNEMAYCLGRDRHETIRKKLVRFWGKKFDDHLRLRTWDEIDEAVYGPQGWWISEQLRLREIDDSD